jgi:hypothetical protein
MTKIAQMVTLENSKEFINILKNRELLIYEDIQGSKIYINYNGDTFTIKPKSLKNQPLNFLDLTLQKYYNFAIQYFLSLPEYVLNLLKHNWWFCFEYFANDIQPANIEYNRLPKNNLILTCVVKGNKYIYDYDEILEYSNLFDVEPLPVIFKGKLSEKQLEVLELYMNTSKNDLHFLFNEENFSYFFYKILNPKIKNSFLMRNDNFNDNLEKLIIKIDKISDYSFEILNPMYHKLDINTNNTEYSEIYSLILLKFLEFCQLISLDKYKLKKLTRDEIYIEIICNLFNEFMKDNFNNMLKWEFIVPNFFKTDKFKINTTLITNKDTLNYIKSNDKIEYIFKCILGSFNKQRKNLIGIFNDTTLNLFNKLIDNISLTIDKSLKINREYIIQKDVLKNFKDYFKLNYNTDSTGKIYPDVYSQFKQEELPEEKKKKEVKKK